jgi:hypothetical protein
MRVVVAIGVWVGFPRFFPEGGFDTVRLKIGEKFYRWVNVAAEEHLTGASQITFAE